MESATDSATDQIIPAASASHKRRYRCPRCHAKVMLRVGLLRVPHFAHVAGEADPDCENFFSTINPYHGKRSWREQTETGRERLSSCTLFFDQEVTGPTLYLWLPPTRRGPAWTGAITFVTGRITRRFTAAHLIRGQRIAFPLTDGQWSLSVEGDIPEDYLSQLDIGPRSLEAGLNLFAADQSPAIQLGPSHPIRLRDSIWVITRNEAFDRDSRALLVTIERRSDSGGWHVFLVTLPTSATREAVHALTQYLQRPVGLPRAKVWIERPWAVSLSPEGLPIFPISRDGLEVTSDAPFDIEIRSHENDMAVERFPYSTRGTWSTPREGTWGVFANDAWFLDFVVSNEPPISQPAITGSIGARPFVNLFELQGQLDELADARRDSASVELRWSSDALASLIRINDVALDIPPLQNEVAVTLFPGDHLRAGNLGCIYWPRDTLANSLNPAVIGPADSLRITARWLISVRSRVRNHADLAISVPAALRKYPEFAGLVGVTWATRYVAHVRALERHLRNCQ